MMKRTKNKTELLKRNGPVIIRSVQSVLRSEESAWWERAVKVVGVKREVEE